MTPFGRFWFCRPQQEHSLKLPIAGARSLLIPVLSKYPTLVSALWASIFGFGFWPALP